MKKIKKYPYREAAYRDILGIGKVGAEFGVSHGLNAINIWQMARPSKLYLVDPWYPVVCYQDGGLMGNVDRDPIFINHLQRYDGTYQGLVESTFDKEINEGSVETVKTKAVDWMKSQPSDSLDFVYIDTTHYLEHTYVELEESIRVVKKDGIIAGHDFHIFLPPSVDGVFTPVLEYVNNGILDVVAMSYERINFSKFPSFFCRNTK